MPLQTAGRRIHNWRRPNVHGKRPPIWAFCYRLGNFYKHENTWWALEARDLIVLLRFLCRTLRLDPNYPKEPFRTSLSPRMLPEYAQEGRKEDELCSTRLR